MTTKNAIMMGMMAALLGCADDNAVSDTPTDGNPDAGDSDTGEEGVLLIDDCDDGDNTNELGGEWISYDDQHDPNGGESEVWPTTWFEGGTFEMSEPGYGDTGYAARITGTTSDKLGYDYVGLIVAFGPDSFCPDPQPAPLDLTQYTGIRFMAKGTVQGGPILAKLFHNKDGAEDNCSNGLTGDTLTEWNDYAADFTDQFEEEWREISLNFRRDFVGPSPVDIETVLEHAKSIHFVFQTVNGGEVDLTVDNIVLYTDTDTDTDTEPPDMDVHEATPPEDETLTDIEIDHPLQAAAMEYLNKGYNITNWLEQQGFDNFDTYNEAFLADLVDAGFESLRLPIDLDRYIFNRTEYLAGDEPLEVDPQLFEILDAFDEWTEATGLSLTIDYHQYDQSFDMDDALVTDAAVALWGAVAEHFADNPRPDLFFELLNEIEQAGGTGEVDQDAWRELAVRIIDEIRGFDDTRPILFGDVAWYSIDRLSSRAPLDDPNVIYVFHFYEPFVFTHQGASWTDLSSVHDIPYPYDADRWTGYYDDIGIDPDVQPGWVMNLIHNYYQEGNPSFLRNRIVEGKRWAVENNVPLICNEFGAWDGASAEADRIAYLTDLIDIFEEFEIPWQHWFMVMDSDGSVDPEIADAFGL